MRDVVRRALPVALTLAVVGALAAYLVEQRDYIAASTSLRPGLLLAAAALVLVSFAFRSGANGSLFGRLGVRASFVDWFRVVTVTAFTNYLPLSAGLFAKGVYLNRVHELPYRTYAVGQVCLLLITVATNGVLGLAALAIALPQGLAGPIGAAFALFLLPVGLVFLPESAARRLSGRFPWLAESAPRVRRALPAVAALHAGALLATAASFALCFAMGAGSISFAACILYAAAIVVTRLVSVVPGALGVREFLVGAVAWLAGFDLRDAVIAATLARVVEIAVVFALGAVFTWGLTDRVAATYGHDR